MDCQQSATGYLFNGKMQDAESNLAHFHYRKLDSLEARWLTPDPAGTKAVRPHNPQSENRYAYAGNAPAQFVDNKGLFIAVPAPFPEPLGFCEPDDYTIDIDGMEAPPCPWLILPVTVGPILQAVYRECLCRSAGFIASLDYCNYLCNCQGGYKAQLGGTLSLLSAECHVCQRRW